LNNPEKVDVIIKKWGREFSAFLQSNIASPEERAVLELKFRKGIVNSALQHMTLLNVLVDVLREPAQLTELLRTEFPRENGDYFAFELNGPGGKDGFTFFPAYSDARHGLMAAAVRLFAGSYERSMAHSEVWQKVEEVKVALTEETKRQGLRKAYRTQPEHNWPPTVWSLSQNLNSALVTLRATLAALNEKSNPERWTWADIQRQFFDRSGDLKGLAGATVETLGEYTQPYPLPDVEVVEEPETGAIHHYKWGEQADARLKQDPGGICFGFPGLHEQRSTRALEKEIRAILAASNIQSPRRFSSVEMLTMVGALLLPQLAPDYPNLHAVGERTLADELIEARRDMQ